MKSSCQIFKIKVIAIISFGLLSLMHVNNANGQTFVYSETFTTGVSYCQATPQYDNWVSYRALLDTSLFEFTKVTIKGSLDTVGRSCTDTVMVNEMATALRNGVIGNWVACNGNTWNVGTGCAGCGVPAEVVEFTASGTDCLCTDPGYILRPAIGNLNWGGIAGLTCSAPTQTMTVVFEYASCSLFTDILVTEPSCKGGSGSLDLTVIDGDPPYTYAWSSGHTIEDPTGLPAGVYTVDVTDLNGCIFSDSATITDPVLFNETICSGNSVPLSANTMLCFGAAPYTYAWTPTVGLSCTTCENPVASPTTTVTYRVVVTDGSAVVDSIDVMVTVFNAVPTANAGNDTTICSQDTLQLAGSGGVQYAWTPGGSLSDSTISNPMAYPQSTTSYILTATNGCGSDNDTVVVTVSPLPVLLSTNTGICPGDTFQLVASGATTYLWSPGGSLSDPTIANPVASPLVSTTYSLTATSALGCITNDNVTISVDSVAGIVAITDQDTICPGGNAQLNVLGSTDCNDYDIATIAFNPPSSVGTNVTLSDDQLSGGLPIGFTFNFYCVDYTTFYISSNGFLTFTGASGNGCCTGQTLPDAAAPNNLIAFAWEDLNPSSGGTITYATFGTAPNRTLVTSFNSVPHFGGANNVTVQVILYEGSNEIEIHSTSMPNDGGGHTMGIENVDGTIAHVVTGRNSTGTWTAVNEGIRFSPLLTIDTTLNYTWTPSTGLSDPNIIDPVASPTVTTTYIVEANIGTCSSSDTITIYIDTSNFITIGASTTDLCQGDTAILSVTGTPGMANTSTWTYAWSPAAGLSDSTVATPLAFPVSTTTYQLAVTNACGTFTDSITLISKTAPTANAGPDQAFCFGGSVQITGSGGVSYLWGPNQFLDCTACDKTNANPPSDMTYYVTAIDSFGCTDVDSVFVEVNGLPISATSTKPFVCSPGDTTQLFVLGNCGGGGGGGQTITYSESFTTGFSYCPGDPVYDNWGSFRAQLDTSVFKFTKVTIKGSLDNIGRTCTDPVMVQQMAGSLKDGITGAWALCDGTFSWNVGSGCFGGCGLPADGIEFNATGTDCQCTTPGYTVRPCIGNLNWGGLNGVTCSAPNQTMTVAFEFTPCDTLDSAIVVSWAPGAGLTDSTIMNPIAGPTTEVTYVVTADDQGCITTDTITIGIDSTVIAASIDTALCVGESALISVTSNTTVTSYQWSPTAGLSSTVIQSPTAGPTNTTTYSVDVTNIAGCTYTDSVVVTIETAPNASFTETIANLQVTFTNTSLNGVSYLWDFGDGFLSTQSDPIHTYNSDGTYTVCLTATNTCGDTTVCSNVTVTLGGCINTVAAFDTVVVDLTVVFADLSSDADTWAWDFGDGTASVSQNPVHSYSADGTYNVCLITTNPCSSDTTCMMITVTDAGTPPCTSTVAGFTSSSVGLDAVFVDGSSDATSWSWDFGDGSTSSAQNPVYTYTSDGSYNVCLIATNACSSDTTCMNVIVSASNCTAAVAGFTSTPSGLTVNFTDTSTDPTGWAWDFGDGNTSASQNPSNTYSAPGIYTVCLVITNPCSTDSICTSITVATCTAPVASFGASDNDLVVSFSDLSTSAISWSWDFGDGNTSNSQNPTYTYSADGTYYVCLTVNSGCATDVFCDSISVASCPAVIAAFTFADSALAVNFTDLSVGAGNWNWDFGDGFNGSTQNATHIYALPGTYTVCLTASNACTSDTSCVAVSVLLTGIEDVTGTSMEVYPNPTDGILNLSVPKEVTNGMSVTIYNLLGEVVYFVNGSELHGSGTNANQTIYTLNINHLVNGSYLLKVQTADKMFMEQVIFSK